MKKIAEYTLTILAFLFLAGCPSGTQQDAAKASLQVTVVMQAAQQGEIEAHNQKLIPDDDHEFIQKQFIILAEADKAANLCIQQAANKGSVLTCLNTAVNTVDGINKDGGLALKSANARSAFNLAITSVKAILQTIIATMGGQ